MSNFYFIFLIDEYDNYRFLLTENGHNTIWNEYCEFIVENPAFALLHFEVQDEDMFGEKNFIGQAVYPVNIKLNQYINKDN